MKKLLGIVVLGLLWCNISNAALFYGKETLPVVSKPEGANCILKNNKGSWEVKTPATVKLKLSKKDVLTKIHGGGALDRKRKLLEKQKKRKARSKQFGRVEIPQEAFIGVLKINKE